MFLNVAICVQVSLKIFVSALFCVGSPGTGCGPKSVSLHTIFTRNLFRGNLRHRIGQKEFIGLSRLGESISPDLTSGICRTCAWKWVETIWLVGTIAVQTQGIPKSGLHALCVCSCNTLFYQFVHFKYFIILFVNYTSIKLENDSSFIWKSTIQLNSYSF